MSYFAPYIDESGFHMPTYNDIKFHLLEEARRIFGQDIYLENDSQDYEFISLMADKLHDTFLTAQLVYNNRSPATAIGGALDGLVMLNGLKRKRATKSTCEVVLTGTADTKIVNGIIADSYNINWDLPPEVIIPESKTLNVLATCQKYGPNPAAIGQLSRIITPTEGWLSVTNLVPAIMGQSVEGQEELRARQTISTAKPSRTVIEGTIGGIAEIPDVTRYRVYENDTNVPDKNTIPGHSICAVVEGGKDYDIANEIYLRKTPGCGTYGDIIINVETGVGDTILKTMPIKFFRPKYCDIYVTATVKQLPGYVTSITDKIKENISTYLNSLQIGEILTVSALWGVSLQAMPSLSTPLFSIISVTAGTEQDKQDTTDIDILFNNVTKGDINNITVNVV